ncbi:hypothetical protein EK21DRAFT_113483 [Setomelanomma holmii]|uniref:Uncharacterized protein n=1 Tax=Setomelanomma holmii TaxID=210430 RepID=A0A9P4H6Z4_9PLEO|nr:hypothetical protein EK21DRAFT_113483 [Setomelanomma holmii]
MCEDNPADTFADSGSSSASQSSDPIKTFPIQALVTSPLSTYKSKAPLDIKIAAADPLMAYLHSNAVRLADVEVLVSTLHWNYNDMNKLATNIGLFHSRGAINADQLEGILTYIFTHDDPHFSLFARTTTQIERFKLAHEAYIATHMSAKLHQKLIQQEKTRRIAQKKAEREAAHRRQTIPAKWRKSEVGLLPTGCASIADIITELDGMNWTQAMKIVKAADTDASGLRKPRKLRGKQVPERHVEEIDRSWAQTRLHNGPGLENRARPKVKLPCGEADAREVRTVNGMDSVVKMKGGKNGVWRQSKVTEQVLLAREGKGIVIRLRPAA